jgi:hypothetical protein
VSTDSYNYFGRDGTYLDEKLLPFVKRGGYVYIAIPGMVRDCRDSLPSELLISWTPEQLDYMHDVSYWTDMVSKCRGAKVLTVEQMQSNKKFGRTGLHRITSMLSVTGVQWMPVRENISISSK